MSCFLKINRFLILSLPKCQTELIIQSLEQIECRDCIKFEVIKGESSWSKVQIDQFNSRKFHNWSIGFVLDCVFFSFFSWSARFENPIETFLFFLTASWITRSLWTAIAAAKVRKQLFVLILKRKKAFSSSHPTCKTQNPLSDLHTWKGDGLIDRVCPILCIKNRLLCTTHNV